MSERLFGSQYVSIAPEGFRADVGGTNAIAYPDYSSLLLAFPDYAAMLLQVPTYADLMVGHPGWPGGVPVGAGRGRRVMGVGGTGTGAEGVTVGTPAQS